MIAAWLKTLDEIEGGDLPLVGGKTFNLATLRRHGLPVLQGLVATCAFFEAHLRQHRLVPLWAGSPNVAVTEDALCWLADTLKTRPLGHDLGVALRARLAETFPGIELFAVRSSAIDEDTRQHAFSGVHLTELAVPRDMVAISLTRCWASALSRPALEYRRQHGIPIQSIKLAVLIQPFIRPVAAGVAFTLNPLTGARDELVIEAAFGLGSDVVSGRVAPTRYRLARHPPDYPGLNREAGDALYPISSTDMSHEITLSRREGDPLSPSQLRTLAQYLEQIEALMSAPQDVEWAVVRESPGEDTRFLFFQARPISLLPGAVSQPDVAWSRADYREFLPDLPSPLCTSLLERTQDSALSFFNRLGFDVQGSGPYLRFIYGRPYRNLTLARRLIAQSGVNPASVLWLLGHAQLPAEEGPARIIDWRQVWKGRRPVARLLGRSLRLGPWLDRFAHLAAEIHHTLAATDWDRETPLEFLSRFRLRTQLARQIVEADFTVSAAAIVAFGILVLGLGSVADEVTQFVKEAIRADMRAGEAQQSHRLLELAGIAQADEQAQRYLSQPRDGYDDYREALAGSAFLAAFDQFMSDYGQHATFEADLGWPRYYEDASPLLAALAHIARVTPLPGRQEDRAAGQHPAQRAGKTTLKSASGWEGVPATHDKQWLPWRRWLAHLAIRRLRRIAHRRVQLRASYGRAMSDCRAWDLKLAARWVTRGWLNETADYFWLTMEEIERALMAEAEVGPTLLALARARRETYQSYAQTEMPYILQESDVARLVPGLGLTGSALASVFSGLPVSPGQVQGQVIVLQRPEDSARMQKGAILVAPSSDPAWFPIFPQARGLIIETGGLLSHGSIIAREFGLPTVANIPDATRRFHDGDLVLLDGSTGLVQILDPASGAPQASDQASAPELRGDVSPA